MTSNTQSTRYYKNGQVAHTYSRTVSGGYGSGRAGGLAGLIDPNSKIGKLVQADGLTGGAIGGFFAGGVAWVGEKLGFVNPGYQDARRRNAEIGRTADDREAERDANRFGRGGTDNYRREATLAGAREKGEIDAADGRARTSGAGTKGSTLATEGGTGNPGQNSDFLTGILNLLKAFLGLNDNNPENDKTSETVKGVPVDRAYDPKTQQGQLAQLIESAAGKSANKDDKMLTGTEFNVASANLKEHNITLQRVGEDVTISAPPGAIDAALQKIQTAAARQ